ADHDTITTYIDVIKQLDNHNYQCGWQRDRDKVSPGQRKEKPRQPGKPRGRELCSTTYAEIRVSATAWPAAISSGTTPRRSATTRRMNSGGKNRSSVHSTNRVGTGGHASSGHGAWPGASAWSRGLRRASPDRSGGPSG